jgi:predicted permease
MFDGVSKDLRFAFRQLAQSKGFTLTAVLTLALGIGANTAIFTLVNAVMLRSLPVADPQRLFRLGDDDNCCVIGGIQTHFSIYAYPLYVYLRDHTPEFEQMAAFQGGPSRVGVRREGGVSEPFTDQFVSGNYFSTFGLRPFAGRLLAPTDDKPDAPPAAVMSYRAWEQHYGADPAVVGASFIVDGAPVTIAGIAPPGFFGDTLGPNPPDFWLPLATEPHIHRRNSLLSRTDQHWLYIIGRIKPGASTAALESRANVELKQWLLSNNPPGPMGVSQRDFEGQHITVAAAGGGVAMMKQQYEHDLRLLMTITGLVLLIACANLANLQLARGTANAGQMSIRVALGAQRARLIRQTLTESLVLAVMGGAAGLFVATELARFLIGLAFHGANYVPIDAAPSLPVLGFAFLLSLITGIVFGIAPAWSASRADPAAALRGAGRSAAGRSTLPQRSLVVLQAAISLVLLTGAGLMLKTFGNLENQSFGFQPQGRMVAKVNAGFSSYAPEKIAAIYREVERQLREIPGVRGVGLSLYTPMSGNNWQSGVTLESQPGHMVSPSWDRVGPGFFETLGARILRGRNFNERDTPDATHVAVVNQAFADKYFPNEDPLGKRFGLGGAAHRADFQIVGMVENVRFRSLRLNTPPMYFLPLLQMSKSEWGDIGKARSNLIRDIVLNVAGNTPDLASRMQRIFAGIDPDLTLLDLVTMDEEIENLLGHERLIARLTELFGALAVLLAAVGLYGMTAYSVARRTGEIGIRTALGATRGRVIGMIVGGALAQIGVGLIIGIPAALAAGRVLADQLYGVKTSDPWILCGAAAILIGAAAIAGLAPALRAGSIDPVNALRM